jgi:leucyl aminopeptidase
MPASVSLGAGNVTEFSGSLLAIALSEEPKLSGGLIDLDRSLNGSIQRAIEMRDFRGARDEIFALSGPAGGARRIVLIGMGKITDRAGSLRRAAAVASRQAMKLGSADLGIYAGELDARETEAITVGLIVGSWQYNDLKAPPPENERRAPLEKATIISPNTDASRAGVASGEAIGAGHSLARTLAMMPGNLCTPEFLANTATEIATRHGMKINVLDRKEMQAEGMGAFLCVAQGTPQDPKLIAVEYSGGKAGDKPVTLVGKGLCFDSGGISIKPAANMEDMKFDMCGAAGVLGALEAIGRMKLPINVV